MATKTEVRKIEIIANGKKAEASFNDLAKTVKILTAQLKKMKPGTKEFIDKTKELKGVKSKFNGVKDAMYGTQQAQKKLTKGAGLLRQGFSLAVKAFLPMFAFSKILELGSSLLNLESQWSKLKGTIAQTSGLQGEALDGAAIRSQAIANTFGEDSTKIFNSAKLLSDKFKITYDEAFTLIEDGMIAAGSKSGEFLEQIGEYSVQFSDAGASAEDFATQTVKALNDGVFSDKGADVIKEFGLRIREQSKASKDALNSAFGKEFTAELFEGINDGSITTVDALKKVSTEMNNTTIPANELQTLVADVFGGAGEDAGMDYLLSLENIGGSMSDLIDSENEFVSKQQERLDLEKELATAQESFTELFEGTSGVFGNIMTEAKILFFDILVKGINWGKNAIVGLVNYFIDLYNESTVFRAAIQYIGFVFKAFFISSKTGFKLLMNEFSTAGKLLKAVFTGNFSEVSDIMKDRIKNQIKIVKDGASEIAEAANTGYKNVISKEKIKPFNLDTEKSVEEAKTTGDEVQEVTKESIKKLAKSNADYQKKKIEAERAFQKLKLSLLEEGIEKELATIDYKHAQEVIKVEDQKTKILENTSATEEEKQALLIALEAKKKELEVEKEEEKEEIKITEKEDKIQKQIDEFSEDLERELLLEENNNLEKDTLIGENFKKTLLAEQEREQALFNLKKEYNQKKLDLLIIEGKGQTTEALKLKNTILKIEKEKADSSVKFNQNKADKETETDKKSEDQKKKIRKIGLDSAKAGLQIVLDLLRADSKARALAAKAYKAIAIGETITDGVKEVQSIWKGVATLGPIAGPILGAVQTALAVGRTIISIKKIEATEYARGGKIGTGKIVDMVLNNDAWESDGQTLTSFGTFASGGHVSTPSMGIIGEAGPEWVAPNWMMKSPKHANLLSYLETERARGHAFADGGLTALSPSPSLENSLPEGFQKNLLTKEAFEELTVYLKENLEKIDEWASTLKVINNPEEVEEALRVINEIDDESTIKRAV